MTTSKVQDIIIEQLARFNINRIYGYAGDTILRFFSTLKDSEIKLYTGKNELTAGLMASAEAKLTDSLAVCLAHSGPGTANIINGIADAYSDRVPLLLITGQVPTYNLATNYKQYVDQQALTNPLTVYSAVVVNPNSVIDLLFKAMTMAISRGGVSHLIIPMDMWEQETNAVPREYPAHLKQQQKPDQNLIDQAAVLINQAVRPVILYGRGCKNCRDQLIELAEKINGGIINTLPAAGIIEFDNPYTLGGLGLGGSEQAATLLAESDLIIILGATWWPMGYVPRRPGVIQFDASKENIAATHPVELGVCGDLLTSLRQLLPAITTKQNTDWKNKINELRTAWFKQLEADTANSEFPLNPQLIIKAISENTKSNEIITLDSGDSVVWFGKFFGNRCKDILVSGTWRTMGFALPAALAAKIINVDQPVTAITGDGGLGMVLAELLTAVRYKLPIRILNLNNGSLAMEKNRMISAEIQPEEVDLTNPDFIKLAEACSVKGIRVNNLNELYQALEQTSNLTDPVLIDIPTAVPIPPGTKLE